MTTISVQNALGVTHSLSVLCKQGTNPNNFAHKVELNFSLQSKPPCPSQRLAFTKAHCSYHLKCEPTAHSAFYMCVYINNVHSQEQHHNLFTMKMMKFLVLACLSAYLWPSVNLSAEMLFNFQIPAAWPSDINRLHALKVS